MQPPHKADLTSPDLTILVQIVKDACAIAVASRYRDLAKYNLRELCNPDTSEQSKAQPAAEKPKSQAVDGSPGENPSGEDKSAQDASGKESGNQKAKESASAGQESSKDAETEAPEA